jgi:TonB family protein
MQKLLFIITALLFPSPLLAAKTYRLTLKVTSLATHSALAGLNVIAIIDEQKIKMGQTDQNGELLMLDLKEKSIDFIIADPTQRHKEYHLFYNNSKKEDQTKEVALRLNKAQEEAHFKAIDAKYPSSTDKDSIDLIDATPVGDMEAFHYYLFESIEYPGECVEQNIEGRVFISCIVQKDGSITHAEVHKSAHPSLDAEALRVIRYAPKWNPATSAGKPIATKVIIPISFDLMN